MLSARELANTEGELMMSDNPIVRVEAYYSSYQYQPCGGGKSSWHKLISVVVLRSEGSERIYGGRPVDIVEGEWIDTPSLSEKQWRRFKRIYDRLRRRATWTSKTDYRPPRYDYNHQPYYYLLLKRKQT